MLLERHIPVTPKFHQHTRNILLTGNSLPKTLLSFSLTFFHRCRRHLSFVAPLNTLLAAQVQAPFASWMNTSGPSPPRASIHPSIIHSNVSAWVSEEII